MCCEKQREKGMDPDYAFNNDIIIDAIKLKTNDSYKVKILKYSI